MKNTSKQYHEKVLLSVLFVTVLLLFDLSSKTLICSYLEENESIQIIGNYLAFTLSYNYGTTFGLFSEDSPYIKILIIKVLSIFILLIMLWNVSKFIKNARYQYISRICLLFLIGGSLGNVIDRLMDKRVTDFIDIGIYGFRWYIFNLADAFQCIGGIAILYLMIWGNRKVLR